MSKRLPYLDLRSVSDCEEIETLIEIRHPIRGQWRRWIRLGYIRVSIDEDGDGLLEGIIGRGATDPEEDVPRVLRLPIGILSQRSFHGAPEITAVILAQSTSFRVPPPGYNPFAEPGARICQTCEDKHPIVPEGFYVPPENKPAYAAARGRIIRLSFRPPRRVTKGE